MRLRDVSFSISPIRDCKGLGALNVVQPRRDCHSVGDQQVFLLSLQTISPHFTAIRRCVKRRVSPNLSADVFTVGGNRWRIYCERSKRNVPHLPDEDDVLRAASILNEGKKIAILAGQGALNARTEIIAVAERLEAPIIKALLGKAVVPDDCLTQPAGLACWVPRRHRKRWRNATHY